MKTNRKYIALLCAISMIFSVFGAFTFSAGAEDISKGIVLEYNSDESTASEACVDVYYTGMDSIYGYTVKVNIPTGATVTYEDLTGMTVAQTALETVFGVSAASATAVTMADKKIGTLKIAGVTSDFSMSLQIGSGLTTGDMEDLYLGDDATASDYMKPAWTYITGDETPEAKKEIKLSDLIDADKITDANKNDDLYITVEVDPSDAVYGTDYAAVYNGTVLGPNDFSNLISGYTDADMADIIAGLTFEIYDTSAVDSITAVLNDGTTNTQLDSGTSTVTPSKTAKPTSTPKASMTVKYKVGSGSTKTYSSTISVGLDKALTLTASYSKATDDGKYSFTVKNEKYLDEVSVSESTGVATYTAAKTGSTSVTIQYSEDDTVIAEETVKVKITSTSSDSSSSSDSDTSSTGNTGVIAGSSNNTTGNTISGLTGYTWTDLGDAAWATEAITALGAKNMVSGRSSTIFDPNANITRAEYCQILVNAIGKTQDSADSSFYDVASDAWYYHAVSVASSLDIVRGYGDGNFGPNDLITRQDMALMTQKAVIAMSKSLASASVGTFSDDADISDYAKDAVYALANAGIINGMGDGTFAPKNNATRAQACVIIYNTFVK